MRHALFVLTAILLCVSPARGAEEAFYRVPIPELQVVEGKLPSGPPDRVLSDWRRGRLMGPRVVIDDGGDQRAVEAFAAPADDQRANWGWGVALEQWAVYVRAPAPRDIKGRLFYLRQDGPGIQQGMDTLRFTIPATAAAAGDRDPFFRARAVHYERLLSQEIPGAAWFRHQAARSRAALSQPETAQQAQARQMNRRADNDLSGTYSLFTGGRAISENLQLDRALPPTTQPNREGTALSTIRGITVKEIDWSPLIKDAKPQLDPLASLIPADQHAIFFPSAAEAAAVLELAEQHATPALQSLEPQVETARLRERYERQLGRTAQDVLKLAQSGLVGELAITGSDPYLRIGADLALLFQTSDAESLRQQLAAGIQSSGIEPTNTEVAGLSVIGGANDERSISTYVAVIGDVVVLTNSREQLRRLAAVHEKSVPALATAPEYVFFRERYQRGEGDESALLVLSDATIRRWCGPRWRIGDSRRTRAAAVLADQQAVQIAARAGNQPTTQPHTDRFVPDLGTLRISAAGVASATYNTLSFMTPIVELDLDKVTTAEADAYGRWRDGYQRNWSWAFDPIAMRLSTRPDRIAGDVTVMPLIDASRYRSMIEMSRGAAINPGTGDGHAEALAHVAYALNVKSKPVQSWAMTLSQFAPQLKVNALDWLGPTVAIYADADPFWADLAAAKDKSEFFQSNLGRLPIGLHAQVSQPLKLAVLLTAMRAWVEQSAPGLTQWENPEHGGRQYVKITANVGEVIGGDMPPIAICYVAAPDSFTLTLNEALLKRAIDRQIARGGGDGKSGAAATQAASSVSATQPRSNPSTRPWLGSNLALHVERPFVEIMAGATEEDPQRLMRSLAWGNLPILNEWRRLYPDRDPLDVHEELWHVRLLEPAGGAYTWNAQWQTMESSVYGHPGEPRSGPVVPRVTDAFKRGSFGIDFEEQGIRARAVLTLQPPTTGP